MIDAERVARFKPKERAKWWASLSEGELADLEYDWSFWSRAEQRAPTDRPWRTWLALAGRGFGKTRMGAEWIRSIACGPTPLAAGKCKRIAIVAETAADARDVVVEGDSGVLAVHPPAFRPLYEPSKRRLTWPNGATALLFNATEPDQLRGPQFDAAWCDELAKWQYAQETWDMLQFGLRLGDDPRQMVTTTPKPVQTLRQIIADPDTVITRGSTFANAANLAPGFLATIKRRYEGTRLGRQELNAELLDDIQGALWTHAMIEKAQLGARVVPDLLRVVVAVDPSGVGKAEEGGDWIGIVAVGKGVDGRGYVLGDYSCKLGPAGWGRRAVEAYKAYAADRIIGEANFGGAMVESVIRAADPNVPYKAVHASRGKVLRAEPVAALYEQGRITHVEPFPYIEAQMTAFTHTGYVGEGSPDRVDALVWAITELEFEKLPSGAALFELMRQRAEAEKAAKEAEQKANAS